MSDNIVVLPIHTAVLPVISPITGNGLTVNTELRLSVQPIPVLTIYLIVVVPALIPFT